MINSIDSDSINTKRLDWLVRHVWYFEHCDNNGIGAHKVKHGGYWPQTEEDMSGSQIEEYVGLSFIDYIDAQLKSEKP